MNSRKEKRGGGGRTRHVTLKRKLKSPERWLWGWEGVGEEGNKKKVSGTLGWGANKRGGGKSGGDF